MIELIRKLTSELQIEKSCHVANNVALCPFPHSCPYIEGVMICGKLLVFTGHVIKPKNCNHSINEATNKGYDK